MPDPWIYADWPAPRHVHAVVSTRHGPGISLPPYDRFNLGLGSGEAVDLVSSNRQRLLQSLKLPSAPRWLQQVHGSTVAELGPLSGSQPVEADAAVSRIPDTVLAILSADCLPVLLCSEDGRTIAAAHAGWRGLAKGVLEATLQVMALPPEKVLVWLGPCIAASSYEVGREVHDAFVAADKQAESAFVATRPGHWLCDLAALARMRLKAAGLQNITACGYDTLRDQRFYSWRRDGRNSGRFASLIWANSP